MKFPGKSFIAIPTKMISALISYECKNAMKQICLVLLLITSDLVSAANPFEALRVDITPLLEQGCRRIQQWHVDDRDLLQCTKLGIKEKFGCDALVVVEDALGGLTPSGPMIECRVKEKAGIETHGVRSAGSYFKTWIQYILYTNGKFVQINTADSFRSYFTPVDSPEEALSFAVALTGSYPLYIIKAPEGAKVTRSVSPSSAKKVSKGFRVHLFKKDVCENCPSTAYSVSAVEYFVTPDGTVEAFSESDFYHYSTSDYIER